MVVTHSDGLRSVGKGAGFSGSRAQVEERWVDSSAADTSVRRNVNFYN